MLTADIKRALAGGLLALRWNAPARCRVRKLFK